MSRDSAEWILERSKELTRGRNPRERRVAIDVLLKEGNIDRNHICEFQTALEKLEEGDNDE
jgi:hypothetical protein